MQNSQKRLMFGVITTRADEPEQKQMLQGIIEQAQLLQIDIAVFSNLYDSMAEENFHYENKIYDLILSRSIDGLILVAESVLEPQLQQDIMQKIRRRQEIPTVVTSALRDGFYGFRSDDVFNTDDVLDMERTTEHLIHVHHFTDIDMLTGYENNPISHLRVQGYRNALERYGIDFRPEKVHFGDFWMPSGEALAARYIQKELPMPQAIVCANDYMAYGLLDAFFEAGIRVPEDISVIGYEAIGNRMSHLPVLTSYVRNRRQVGANAVCRLFERITEKSCKKRLSCPEEIFYGDSCPCGIQKEQIDVVLKNQRIFQQYQHNQIYSLFEQRLTLCRSMEEYIHTLNDGAYLIRGVKEIYLCLHENWSECSGVQNEAEMLCYPVLQSKQSHYTSSVVHFSGIQLLPEQIQKRHSAAAYYFSPVFFAEKQFGYMILIYDAPDGYDILYRSWIKSVSNALEFLRMKNDIRYLLECQNLSLYHDTVTGLYNETGFEHAITAVCRKASPETSVILCLLQVDMFTDELNMERQKQKLDMQYCVAMLLQTLCRGAICSRIAENTFVFAALADELKQNAEQICEKLKIMLLHTPAYFSCCGLDSFALCNETFYAEQLLKTADILKKLQQGIEQQKSIFRQRRQHSFYNRLMSVRNALYADPVQAKSMQEICQYFSVSEGHFRLLYKECFGKSYHQDCICSRISLAKYLLCTTAMNIANIAEKCGYDDEKYFMRQFQKTTAMSAGQFRMLYS